MKVSAEKTPFDEVRRAALREYAAHHSELRAAGEEYIALITGILDDARINYLSVTGRTKSVTSFAAKAVRTRDGVPVYSDPIRQITDQLGVRVVTYVHSDVAAVVDLMADQLQVLDDRDLGQETASEGRFGYASRHVLLRPEPGSKAGRDHPRLAGHVASVQIRTVLQHAWAEFEHDIRYKGTVPEKDAPDLDRRFTLAAGLLELADREFSAIRDRIQAGMGVQHSATSDDDPRIDAQDLAAFLAGQFPNSGWSRTDHYTWIAGLLLELGIVSLEELADVLAGVDSVALNDRMGYRYPPGAVRRLDDALLAAYEERYIDLHLNSHRTELLQARLVKLRSGGTKP